LQAYSFVLKYNPGIENKAVDALICVTLLSVMSVEDTEFERLKEKDESCPEFGEIYMALREWQWEMRVTVL